MLKFFDKVRTFMIGRNGIDKLTFFLVFLYLIINGIKTFFRFKPAIYFSMWGVALLILGIAAFRVLSKNTYRRQYENEQFEKLFVRIPFGDIARTIRKKKNRVFMRIKQFKTHRFRTCPGCDEHLRMKKKRGLRTITCPKCGRTFKRFILF